MSEFLKQIKKFDFPKSEYFQEEHPKHQIYLHHTAGGPKAEDVYRWWIKDPPKVATCVVISRNGEIVQGFSSKHWAYHLGLKTKHFDLMGVPYKSLDKISIGIEICNWGQLRLKDGNFYNYVNKIVPKDEVYELKYPHRGYRYYQDYTPEQIKSVSNLLLYWNEFYGIPLTYNEDIWDLTLRAFKGESGVFTHNSVRPDKFDVYPNSNLINMLVTL
jgi:N-acetyl-anhydromuramyl-L-alanine amidase AmpD